MVSDPRIPAVCSGAGTRPSNSHPHSVLVFPSLPAMTEWLFGTVFLRNQPRHQSTTVEGARGAAACQQECLGATLMDVVGKKEESLCGNMRE